MSNKAVQTENFPHPREVSELIGHETVERKLAELCNLGRVPPAILILGPKGIGKATLAYRLARYVLTAGATGVMSMFPDQDRDSLYVPLKDEVFSRVASQVHPDLFALEKGTNLRTGLERNEITIDEARELQKFLKLTPSGFSPKIAIIDAADEMNLNAANSILKSLEEPPGDAMLILISHAPRRLLPTIRSRCQNFTLRPLSRQNFGVVVHGMKGAPEESKLDILWELSQGSPGRALAILRYDGLKLYTQLVQILITAPTIDFSVVHALADTLSKKGSEHRFTMAMELLLVWLKRLITNSAYGTSLSCLIEGEEQALRRFHGARRLDHWAELWENLNQRFYRAEKVHLDRKQVFISFFSAVSDLLYG